MTETTEIIRAYLETQSTLALATVNAAGYPEVTPLFYVSDERLNLYWLSAPSSRHSVNLTARPRVAATVYASAWQWSDIVGLQIEGSAEVISDERVREQITVIYLRKFTLPGEFDTIIAGSALYVLRPHWLRWMDNSVKFGHREEITLT